MQEVHHRAEAKIRTNSAPKAAPQARWHRWWH